LITSDVDERDASSSSPDSRTAEGFYRLKDGTGLATASPRKAFADYADMLWWETSTRISTKRKSSRGDPEVAPRQADGYNCSPRSTGKPTSTRAPSQVPARAGAMATSSSSSPGRVPQPDHGMFELARGLQGPRLAAYSELQQGESPRGARLHRQRHQRRVATGYFDEVAMTISGGQSSTRAGRLHRGGAVQERSRAA